jgi:hypothetical protein
VHGLRGKLRAPEKQPCANDEHNALRLAAGLCDSQRRRRSIRGRSVHFATALLDRAELCSTNWRNQSRFAELRLAAQTELLRHAIFSSDCLPDVPQQLSDCVEVTDDCPRDVRVSRGCACKLKRKISPLQRPKMRLEQNQIESKLAIVCHTPPTSSANTS